MCSAVVLIRSLSILCLDSLQKLAPCHRGIWLSGPSNVEMPFQLGGFTWSTPLVGSLKGPWFNHVQSPMCETAGRSGKGQNGCHAGLQNVMIVVAKCVQACVSDHSVGTSLHAFACICLFYGANFYVTWLGTLVIAWRMSEATESFLFGSQSPIEVPHSHPNGAPLPTIWQIQTYGSALWRTRPCKGSLWRCVWCVGATWMMSDAPPTQHGSEFSHWIRWFLWFPDSVCAETANCAISIVFMMSGIIVRGASEDWGLAKVICGPWRRRCWKGFSTGVLCHLPCVCIGLYWYMWHSWFSCESLHIYIEHESACTSTWANSSWNFMEYHPRTRSYYIYTCMYVM